MVKIFSFEDCLRIPAFKDMTSIDLLHPKMDARILPFFFVLGANIDKGVVIQACKHRTIQNKETLGWRYVFPERMDKEWLSNRNCSMAARIHSQEDKWLAADMVRYSQEGLGEVGFKTMCLAAFGADGTARGKRKDRMDSWQDDREFLLILRDIQLEIRGYLHPDEDMFLDEKI